MIAPICHIPTDEEAGLTEQNARRRVQFICSCAICKRDFEVRDGRWLPMSSKKGTVIKIKVCDKCFASEEVDEVR